LVGFKEFASKTD